jgi:dihydropteroate synthase-like protein
MNSQKKTRLLLIGGSNSYKELMNLDWDAVKDNFIIKIIKGPNSTAAFITRKQLDELLSSYKPEDFDYVLLSGLVPWDLQKSNSQFSKILRKGPKFLVNLPEIIENFDLTQLSSIHPADKIYKTSIKTTMQSEIDRNTRACSSNSEGSSFILSDEHPDIIFCPNLPPVLIGEIIDAVKMSFEEISRKITYFIESGVRIIDIGCVANEDHSEEIFELIVKLKDKFSIPFSIDSFNPDEINAAVKAGAEMVLSANLDNYHQLFDLPKSIPIVIVPMSLKGDGMPRSPKERIAGLMSLGKIMSEKGFQKIIMDPLTGTPINPGLTETIETLRMLKDGLNSLPSVDENNQPLIRPQLFMGFSNVTELIDGDSPGINALLALMAAELDVTAILSTEYSKKSRHNLEELSQSIQFAYYAKIRNVPPLKLGIDAFRLKSNQKYSTYIPYDEPCENIPPSNSLAKMDPNGYFRICIDEHDHLIQVTHFNNVVDKKDATKTFCGTTAESIYKQIITQNLISRLDHAAYLGKELALAEMAMKYGTPYNQK